MCYGKSQPMSSWTCPIYADMCVQIVSKLQALTAHLLQTITATINEVVFTTDHVGGIPE